MLNSIKNPKSNIKHRLQSTIERLLAPIQNLKSIIQNFLTPNPPCCSLCDNPWFKIR